MKPSGPGIAARAVAGSIALMASYAAGVIVIPIIAINWPAAASVPSGFAPVQSLRTAAHGSSGLKTAGPRHPQARGLTQARPAGRAWPRRIAPPVR